MQDDAAPLDPTRTLELRVNAPSVRLYPVPPPTISTNTLAATAMTPDTTPPANTPSELSASSALPSAPSSATPATRPQAQNTHDICDPANLRGSLLVWTAPQQQSHRPHRPANCDDLRLRSSRRNHCRPLENQSPQRRDGECRVTAADDPLANRRICLADINFPEVPLRMEGDSDDDEGTDSEASLGLDLGRDVESSLEQREERRRAVAQWISTTL
ncbi:hypothetical protein B0H11DRAFT_2367633 [Mycena galericulata]|nr:hypothetical protein B0H11DRAFT_2367633 [Mycena galericulata]